MNQLYTYSSSTTDPEDEQVSYWFDWGDDTNSGWVGPFDSGDTGSATHTWLKMGKYEIKVKAKDIHGMESAWSDPLPIKMPMLSSTPLTTLLHHIGERFHRFFPVLQNLF